MIKTFAKLLARLHLKNIKRRERQIGYKLVLPNIPKTWIAGWATFDLTKNWKSFGLDVVGVDYFTLGNVVNGLSTRFDPKAKQYQSWLGGYLVKFSHTKQWTIQDHFSLAVVDQTDWLRRFGDPSPVCELHPSGFQEAGEVEVCGYKGKLYVGGGISHSDVGKGNKGLWLKLSIAFMASVINLTNPKLGLTGPSFIPKATINSYETVYLKGYIVILEVAKGAQAVLYGNGAVFINSEGKEIDTFELLKPELLSSLKAIVIEKT